MTQEHYFSSSPTASVDRQRFSVAIRGKEYTFETDAGVFSRGELDYGTRLLIETVPIPDTGEILDLGCGYGPIGVVISDHLKDGRVTMVDINERAVELSRINLALNNCKNAEVIQGDGFQPIQGRKFSVILTNPPIRAGKKVIYPMVEDAANHLVPDGRLYLVIRTKQGAASMEKKLCEAFGNVQTLAKSKGYRVFEAVRK